jgi:hypothetical protein
MQMANSNNLNRTLNNPISKIKKNFNIFKWSSDLNGIDENILKQEKFIRESQNQINIATRKRNQLKSEKELLLNEAKFYIYNNF